jgi:hypothetical protein
MAREGRRVPTWRRHVSPSPPPPEPQSFATPLFRHRPSPTSSPKGEQKWQDSANPAEGEEDQHQDHVQEEPKKPFLDENDERKRVSAHLIYSRTGAEALELKKLCPEKAAAAGNDVFGVGLELCSCASASEHFHSLVTCVFSFLLLCSMCLFIRNLH